MAPAAPRLIDRGDLVAALDRAAARKVTVISAPAGSGKTSLLRAWAGRPGQPRRLALVQVQRDQHDAQQFWLALLGAVRHATGADSGAEPPAATPDFNAPAMVDRVLSELADARGGVTLVIDDLHELTLARSPRSAHPAADEPSPARARDSDHASRCAAGPASAAPGRRAGRDPRGRPALFRARNPRASRRLGYRAVRGRGGAAAPADGGVGRGAAARGDLAGRPPRPGAVRHRVLRQRAHGRGVPARRDAGPPAARRPGSAAAHLAARPGQRRAGRPADRPPGLGTDPARVSKTRTRSSNRWTPGAPGSATTTCSRICSGWSCAGGCPKKYPRCTGAPPDGSPCTAS